MKLTNRKIKQVRAYVIEGCGADYHDQAEGHWLLTQKATPMSFYPEYKETRSSFGLNVLKTLVVEIEADNGEIGYGISTGGYPGAWLVMNHLQRFIVDQAVENIEKMWDQMFRASIFYGRKGLALNAISAVDLALWDLLGKIRQEPVYAMIGGKVREELVFYATGPRPDLAKEMGFIGGKMACTYAPVDGFDGMRKNIAEAAEMRNRVGSDFILMYDCWMALDLAYARELTEKLAELDFKWIEECFMPDDYWSYKELRNTAGNKIWITTGEHEATRYGFRMLIEECKIDLIQPDIGWCGGLTELIRIGNLAEAHGKMVIPHGSGAYSHHYVSTKTNSPYAEYVMTSPKADEVVPQFYPLIKNEPVPVQGKLKLSDTPGFGVEFNREDIEWNEVKAGAKL
ncbi:MAG: L-rhamnonate dehydratase [Christensenellales bacterium]|jgi:L-rhamnonate dehydratase